MDSSVLLGEFLEVAGEVLADLKGQAIAEIDRELLKLKRAVLREKLEEFQRELAAKVSQDMGKLQQDMISRGLGNTTVRLTMLGKIDREAADATEKAVREYNRAIEEIGLHERRIRESGWVAFIRRGMR